MNRKKLCSTGCTTRTPLTKPLKKRETKTLTSLSDQGAKVARGNDSKCILPREINETTGDTTRNGTIEATEVIEATAGLTGLSVGTGVSGEARESAATTKGRTATNRTTDATEGARKIDTRAVAITRIPHAGTMKSQSTGLTVRQEGVIGTTTVDAVKTGAGRIYRHQESAFRAMTVRGESTERGTTAVSRGSHGGKSTLQEGIGRKRITRVKR